jgi:hypothetical protein
MTKRRNRTEAQADLFAPRVPECSALAVFEAPPEHVGRLLGWVYPGDVRIMYGQPFTVERAYNRRWAWWRKYREAGMPG